MSGFEVVAPLALGAASTVAGAIAKNQAASASAQAQADAQARQNQLVLQQQAAQEQQQLDQLAKDSATRRAHMAANGMDGAGGSAAAILAGMSADTADAINQSSQRAQLKLQSANTGSSSNLLDAAGNTQTGLSVFRSFYDSMG